MTDQQKLNGVSARLEQAVKTEVKLRRSARSWLSQFMTITEGIGMGVLCLWAIFQSSESAQGYVLVGMSAASVLAMIVSKHFQDQAMKQLRIDLERLSRLDHEMVLNLLERIEAQHAKGEPATAPKESTH